MQAPNVPVITPKTVQFNASEKEEESQTIFILNPLPFDVHFKVDISSTDRFGISLNRGIICTCQKLPLEVTCKTKTSCVDSIQLRFYKWSRPRQGQLRAGPQRYLGFRQLQITVSANSSDSSISEACCPSLPADPPLSSSPSNTTSDWLHTKNSQKKDASFFKACDDALPHSLGDRTQLLWRFSCC